MALANFRLLQEVCGYNVNRCKDKNIYVNLILDLHPRVMTLLQYWCMIFQGVID